MGPEIVVKHSSNMTPKVFPSSHKILSALKVDRKKTRAGFLVPDSVVIVSALGDCVSPRPKKKKKTHRQSIYD